MDQAQAWEAEQRDQQAPPAPAPAAHPAPPAHPHPADGPPVLAHPHYQPLEQPQQQPPPPPLRRGLRTSLAEWALPPGVVAAYEARGVRTLFPWQAAALECGEDGSNLVYCAPTSGGKSLVADVLMTRRLLGIVQPSRTAQNAHPNVGGTSVQYCTNPRALVVLPYISIVAEKAEHLGTILKPVRVTVRGYCGSDEARQPLAPGGEVVAVCTMEKANACVNKLAAEGRLGELACVVVDELHMVADPGRGHVLELVLTKLLHCAAPGALQIVGMSATMGGLDALATWLRARLFVTNYRPVPLAEYAVFKNAVYKKIRASLPEVAPSNGADEESFGALSFALDSDACPLAYERDLEDSPDAKRDPDGLIPLLAEVTLNGHSALVFCGTKKKCETTAAMVADLLPQPEDLDRLSALKMARQRVVDGITAAAGAPPPDDLQRAIFAGVAWHHAGLTMEERSGVESGYRSGALQILCATSTLAAGVNLPARRVILRSLVQGGRQRVGRAQYLQMVGRAGRAGQSDVGEAFVVGKGVAERGPDWEPCCRLITEPVPHLESRLLGDDVVAPEPEKTKPKGENAGQHGGDGGGGAATVADPSLPDTRHVERLLLETVCSGAVADAQGILELLRCTLAARQPRGARLPAAAVAALGLLAHDKRLLRAHGPNGSLWAATDRGRAVYDSALPLDLGLRLYGEISAAATGIDTRTPLHAVYLALGIVSHDFRICDWPRWRSTLAGQGSRRLAIARTVGVLPEAAHAVVGGSRVTPDLGSRHSRFAAALVVSDACAGEETAEEVSRRWGAPNFLSPGGLSRGQLQKLQGETAQAMAMAGLLCESAGWWPLATVFHGSSATVAAGVRRELLPLMEVPGITAGQARALYKAGITDPMCLASAAEEAAAKALAAGLAAQMRSRPAGGAGGDAKQKQGGRGGGAMADTSGARAAKAVAGRAARALIAAARDHVVAKMELGQAVERAEDAAEVREAQREALPDDAQAARVAVAAGRGAWGRAHSSLAELRPSSDESAIVEFLTAWAPQPAWAMAVSAAAPPGTATGGGGGSTQPGTVLQGFAVCWSAEEVTFVDFSERHRARELPQGCPAGATLAEAVSRITASNASEKTFFSLQDALPLLHDAGIPLGGPLTDLKAAAALVAPPAPSALPGAPPAPLAVKSLLEVVAPSSVVRVPTVARAGVTPACRGALMALAAGAATKLALASRGLHDCYALVDLPAAVAAARGLCALPPAARHSLLAAEPAAVGGADAAAALIHRPLCVLDALTPPQYGQHEVTASSPSLEQELASGALGPAAAAGAPVAVWVAPTELRRRPGGGQNAMLMLGFLVDVGAKRLRGNDGSEAGGGGTAMATVAVPPMPWDPSDPDSPSYCPSSIEIARPADQVWRLAPAATPSALLPPPLLNAQPPPPPAHTVRCQVLAWASDAANRLSPSSDHHKHPNNPDNTGYLVTQLLAPELTVLAHLTRDSELSSAAGAPQPWARLSATWSVATGGVAAGPAGPVITHASAAAVTAALVRGWGPVRLAKALGPGVTKEQAAAATASFLAAFPGVQAWREAAAVAWEANRHYVITLAGRRLRVQDTSRGDPKLKGRLVKAALTAQLGGSVDDLVVAAAGAVAAAAAAGEMAGGALFGAQGRVIVVSVQRERAGEAAAAVREGLRVLPVGRTALAVPVAAAVSCAQGSLHPAAVRPI